jgi:hypothetical protein
MKHRGDKIDNMVDHILYMWRPVIERVDKLLNCGAAVPSFEDRPMLAHKINELIMSINSCVRRPHFALLYNIFDRKMETLDDLREGNLSWNLCRLRDNRLQHTQDDDLLELVCELSDIMSKYSYELEILMTVHL